MVVISEHLQILSNQLIDLNDYFKDDLREKNEWIQDPFHVKPDDPIDIHIDKMSSLMEVTCDGSLNAIFCERMLTEFWLTIRTEYPPQEEYSVLFEKVAKFLFPFCITWMCKIGFSVVV